MIKKTYNKIKFFYERYERILMPTALLFGIVVDYITFASINIISAFVILLLHILLSGIAIAFLNYYEVGKINKESRFLGLLRLAAPLVIQFSFGALLSASFIFYLFSGSFYVSWPLILLLLILMLSNDILRKYYLRPKIQIGVYYFLIFSISAIILPYAFKAVGIWLFISAGILSLILIVAYIKLLYYLVNKDFTFAGFVKIIAPIFILMNIFYFTNIIPPVPLSLKDAVVGHDIQTVNGNYILKIEEESFWQKFLPGQLIHKTREDDIAVYTAIFAPGDLHTEIVHDWQYKQNGKWVSIDKFSFALSGGRKEGFRGYSLKASLSEGKWRVLVKTEGGQVLGRVRFDVVEASVPNLQEIIK